MQPTKERVISRFFFSSRRRHTRSDRDWSSDVCSSDVEAFDEGRTAARGSDLAAAAAAVRKASGLMSAVTDYVVLRQAAETSPSALRAAGLQDRPAVPEAPHPLHSSNPAPGLLARLPD